MLSASVSLPIDTFWLRFTKLILLSEVSTNPLNPRWLDNFDSDKQLKKLKERFKTIIVFYDNDLPGIKGMQKIKSQYPNLNFFWIPRKYGAKDTSDFVKKYGINKTRTYIEQLKEYYGKK